VGLVQLRQHSVDEIKDRQRQIKAELNRHELGKVDRETLKAEWQRLDTENQGNVIVGAYLRRLDSVGQRNGLQLGDITVSIDPRHDFTGVGLSREQVNRIRESVTNAFVLNRGGPIYVPMESILYRNSIGNIEFQDFGGVVLRHEQVHTQGGGEFQAYTVQRLSAVQG
jgi:hypothetical protein